jgi:GMP synthase-like glutamine amidotransferase
MKILIVDNGSKHLRSLRKIFVTHTISVVKLENLNLDTANKADLVILSGGHKMSVVNHRKEFVREIQLIKRCSKPLLGICLGFELIAVSFGSKLKKMKNREHGIVSLKIFNHSGLLKNISNLKVYEGHRWVVSSLSKSLTPLAESKDGIEIFQHKTKAIFGFQFHPEIIVDKADEKQLWANVVKRVKLGIR